MNTDFKTEHALDYSQTSKELTSSLSKKEKKDNGIYFTPPSCVRKNIELLKKYLPGEIKEGFTILEPSCGSGEYIKALCEDDMLSLSKITGIEINKTIFDAIRKLHVTHKNTNTNVTLLNDDFIGGRMVINNILSSPKKGEFIYISPSESFNVEQVIDGDRYCLISYVDIHFKNNKSII